MANRYSNEGRQEAVKLAREIWSKTASERLGINLDTLYTWISKDKKHGEAAFVGSGNKRAEDHDVEIERLQKELHEAREEIEILQDALGFFVKRRKK